MECTYAERQLEKTHTHYPADSRIWFLSLSFKNIETTIWMQYKEKKFNWKFLCAKFLHIQYESLFQINFIVKILLQSFCANDIFDYSLDKKNYFMKYSEECCRKWWSFFLQILSLICFSLKEFSQVVRLLCSRLTVLVKSLEQKRFIFEKYLKENCTSDLYLQLSVKYITNKYFIQKLFLKEWQAQMSGINGLTIMLVVANLVNTKWCIKPYKWLKLWQMGTHLKELIESYPVDTNKTRFTWFSKVFASLCFWQK